MCFLALSVRYSMSTVKTFKHIQQKTTREQTGKTCQIKTVEYKIPCVFPRVQSNSIIFGHVTARHTGRRRNGWKLKVMLVEKRENEMRRTADARDIIISRPALEVQWRVFSGNRWWMRWRSKDPWRRERVCDSWPQMISFINVCVCAHPEAVAEPCAGGGACRTDVATHSWILIGCCVQVCHWPRTAGTQKASTWGGGACENV